MCIGRLNIDRQYRQAIWYILYRYTSGISCIDKPLFERRREGVYMLYIGMYRQYIQYILYVQYIQHIQYKQYYHRREGMDKDHLICIVPSQVY